MGILSILTIIFVIAKLLGAISWGWWLVFTPFLIEAAISIIALIIGVVVTWKSV